MEVNKKQLKIVSRDFIILAKRVLNSDYQDYYGNLNRFLKHIKDTQLLNDYVQSTITEPYDVEADVKEIQKTFGRWNFDIGETEEQEIANIFQILDYLVKNQVSIFTPQFISAYCPSSNKYQDMMNAFNSRVVNIFIQNIENYLTKIMINMGYDEEANYMIKNESGGVVQVNIAKDNSVLNANQEVNINYNELSELTNRLEKLLDENIDKEVKDEISTNIECINDELRSGKPKKNVLLVCKNALYNILSKVKGMAELTAAIMAIIDFIDKLPK